MGQFYQWNRLAIKFSREPKIALLQIDWGTESESGYVWTGKFDLNTDTCGRGNFCRIRKEKFADSKNIRICLNRGYRYDRTAISIKLENVTRATMARKFARKCAARSGFFLFINQTCCMFFLFSSYLRRHRGCLSSPVALSCETTINMRRFRWKADGLMGKGRRKRRPQLLANREARIWKQFNLLSWMLATILTKYCGSFAVKNPPSELELCV